MITVSPTDALWRVLWFLFTTYRKVYDSIPDFTRRVPKMTEFNFADFVDVIKDWPEPGQAVMDISRLLEHPKVFHKAVADGTGISLNVGNPFT